MVSLFILLVGCFISMLISSSSLFFSWWFTISLGLYVAWLDWRDYYIPFVWMMFSLVLLLIWKVHFDWSCLLFLVPTLILYRLKWMGSADVFYIGLFSLLLGWQRMIVCMLVAIGCGFLMGHKKLIPFVSCLWVGFFVSLWRGFLIYGILMAWK